MSRTVYKYPVPIDDVVALDLPVGAAILTVQVQAATPCIWALIDPKAPLERRFFRWFGTGQPIDLYADPLYIGTVQSNNGALVFHLFEEV